MYTPWWYALEASVYLIDITMELVILTIAELIISSAGDVAQEKRADTNAVI